MPIVSSLNTKEALVAGGNRHRDWVQTLDRVQVRDFEARKIVRAGGGREL